MEHITIKGAKEHNLKNVSLELPKNKLIVFTGVSGSGKSSMAFDTIYAEGQRRYVESLSSYARQFLGIMGKPDVESIIGLSPAISIDQKSVSHNPRSTVGTITEIYDYLRLLFAKIGRPFCPNCKREIAKLSIDEIVDTIVTKIRSQTLSSKLIPHIYTITSPVVRNRKGEFSDLLDNLRSKGYSNVLIDTKKHSLEEDLLLIKTNKHTIEVIVDSFSLQHKQMKDSVFVANLRSRIFAAVEQATNLSDGLVVLLDSQSISTLYSQHFSCPSCGMSLPEIEPRMFSFNSPVGACKTCKGLGYLSKVDEKLVINKRLSIDEGGILPFSRIFFKDTWYSRVFRTFLDEHGINTKVPIGQLTEAQMRLLLHGDDKVYKVMGKNRYGDDTAIWEKFIGVIPELEKKYLESESEFTQHEVGRFMHEKVCDSCLGKRLKPEVLSINVDNVNIWELCENPIDAIADFITKLESKISEFEKQVVKDVLIEIKNRLIFLVNVGLAYLTLNRSAATLSGGEAQRIRLASQIGSGLTGVIYVLDEPSIGLHAKDVAALVESLKNLRNIGNTLIVVEHDLETIEAADYIVDFGLYAGKRGGNIIYSGPLSGLNKNKDSLTARYLYQKRSVLNEVEEKGGTSYVTLSGCNLYNLKNITAKIPLNRLSCVTGVSGSGKSTLVVESLYKALAQQLGSSVYIEEEAFSRLDGHQYIDKVYLVDQSPIGKTPRSNPCTYVGAFDGIRDIFAQTQDAKMKGYKKGRFSFNVKGGRCEKCMGAGTVKIEMQFLPDVYVVCDVCSGRRYNSETLEVFFKSKNIYDVLQMTVTEACEFFKSHPAVYHKLKMLDEVGLGYIELGQPAPTLSGGEAQRVKLAFELSKKDTGRTFYILDEPTTGLHMYDIENLLKTLRKLVDKGNTVVIIEHNLDVIASCDYVLDLGPDGGAAGGEIVYQGGLAGIIEKKNSHTGLFLKKYVENR